MTTAPVTRLASRSTVLTVLIGILGTALAVSALAFGALALGATPGFAPLNPPVYLAFAVLGLLAGVAGWIVVTRRVRRPLRLLRVLVPALVVLSWIPDVILLATGFIPGASPLGVAALMLMHPVVAAAAVLVGRRIAPAS